MRGRGCLIAVIVASFLIAALVIGALWLYHYAKDWVGLDTYEQWYVTNTLLPQIWAVQVANYTMQGEWTLDGAVLKPGNISIHDELEIPINHHYTVRIEVIQNGYTVTVESFTEGKADFPWTITQTVISPPGYIRVIEDKP